MATIDVMISEEEIAKKVEELAKQIEKDYEGEQLLVVGILKGASVFVSDLIRKINLDVNIDFMSVSGHKVHGPKGIGFIYVKEKFTNRNNYSDFTNQL